MEPFSISAFKVLVRIFATTTKICTHGDSTQAHSLGFRAHRDDPPTRCRISPWVHVLRQRLVLVSTIVNCYGVFENNCDGGPADLVFVLDSSSSIWPPHYYKQLEFAQNVISEFDVGPEKTQTRIGVLTFSDSHQLHFNLDQNLDKSMAMAAIMKTPYRSGGTNTADALWYLGEHMFSVKTGSRPNAKHIAVVITDGESHNPEATQIAAEAAKKKGIQIFAIGVGDAADLDELEAIASTPSENFVFRVATYTALNSIQKSISQRTCEGMSTSKTHLISGQSSSLTKAPTTTRTTTTTTERPITETSPNPIMEDQEKIDKACGGKPADVFFLLDSSSSIELPDFDKPKNFVKNVVNLFDIGAKKTRVGVSTFSYEYEPHISLAEYDIKSDLLMAIENTSYLSGGTNTGDAIRNVRETVFMGGSARREVGHVLIVLTDGMSKIPETTKMEAMRAKDEGIYIFAIGIGDNIDIDELRSISSKPNDNYMFQVDSFDALESIRDILAIRSCEVPVSDQPDICPVNTDTDVLFVFDSAGIGRASSITVLSFINEVTRIFETKSSYVTTSILSSNCIEADIPFTSEFRAEIVNLINSKSSESTKLIKRMRLEGFATHRGGRASARHVAVLFIDDTLDSESFLESQRARFRNMDLFVVAIGDRVNLEQARLVCGGGSRLLVVPDYQHLMKMSKEFSINMCEATKSKKPVPTTIATRQTTEGSVKKSTKAVITTTIATKKTTEVLPDDDGSGSFYDDIPSSKLE
ncbi:hypothetical protein ScPMuIL_002754 [Solemya velum]